MYRVELLGKRIDASLRELREALGDESGRKYVAAAYGVVFLVVLVWVAIVAAKLARLERETAELAELARAKPEAVEAGRPMAELLVWPGADRLRRGRRRLRR